MKKLIKTKGTKYAQNLAPFAIVDDAQIDGKPLMLDPNILHVANENADADVVAEFMDIVENGESDDEDDDGSYFDLALAYSKEPNQMGVYQILLKPDDLSFNEDMVTITQGNVYFGNHVTVKVNDLTVATDGYYITDIPSVGGWTLIITDEDAIALIEDNGGFEGITISIKADAGIATLDNATSNAFEIEFVYGEDLPDSLYPDKLIDYNGYGVYKKLQLRSETPEALTEEQQSVLQSIIQSMGSSHEYTFPSRTYFVDANNNPVETALGDFSFSYVSTGYLLSVDMGSDKNVSMHFAPNPTYDSIVCDEVSANCDPEDLIIEATYPITAEDVEGFKLNPGLDVTDVENTALLALLFQVKPADEILE
ncbi:MAG: hypothetical protein J6Y28_08160 [Acholeplasmatales bacterium]|nr:hypothetical protein [Acholeplasmatales bacterium]